MRVVSDLNWITQSPALIDAKSVAEQLSLDYIDIDDRLSRMSFDSINNQLVKYTRLGKYFEQLFSIAMTHSHDFELIEQNVQLFRERQTLGEFDAIIESCHDHQTIHAELAVKFFIQRGSGHALSDWVGPGLRDRMDLKYQHLIHHQLQLSAIAHTIEQNSPKFLPVDHVTLVTRGRLYYRYDDYIAGLYNYPNEIAHDHLKGFWITQQEYFKLVEDDPSIEWYDLIKPYWLAEIESQDVQYLPQFEVKTLIGAKQVVAIQSGKELMRGFVVTPHWLERAGLN